MLQTASSATSVRPPKPTFPAYSSSASNSSSTISAPPTIKKPESSSGMSVKLVHPDEDISLVRPIYQRSLE